MWCSKIQIKRSKTFFFFLVRYGGTLFFMEKAGNCGTNLGGASPRLGDFYISFRQIYKCEIRARNDNSNAVPTWRVASSRSQQPRQTSQYFLVPLIAPEARFSRPFPPLHTHSRLQIFQPLKQRCKISTDMTPSKSSQITHRSPDFLKKFEFQSFRMLRIHANDEEQILSNF